MAILALQDLLDVSDMTVRRCLDEMAEDGLMRRIHGGVVSINIGLERLFSVRPLENFDSKVALARETVKLVFLDSGIHLDGGATCFEVARQLSPERKCFVVTDGIAVTRELRSNPGPEAILLAADDNTLDAPPGGGERVEDDDGNGHLLRRRVQYRLPRERRADQHAHQARSLLKRRGARSAWRIRARSTNCASSVSATGTGSTCSSPTTNDRLPDEARSAIAGAGVEVRVVRV
jgi:hypothetical protein